MANMSYCRFQNTSKDLQDCIDEIESMLNNNGKNEYGEKLSHGEKTSFLDMIEQTRYFNELAEDLATNYFN